MRGGLLDPCPHCAYCPRTQTGRLSPAAPHQPSGDPRLFRPTQPQRGPLGKGKEPQQRPAQHADEPGTGGIANHGLPERSGSQGSGRLVTSCDPSQLN